MQNSSHRVNAVPVNVKYIHFSDFATSQDLRAAAKDDDWRWEGFLIANFFVKMLHQIVQRCSTGRTMASPVLQLNAFWNSGKLESGPMTRYLLTGCELVSTN